MIQQEAVPMTYFYLLLTGKAKIIKDQANGKRALLHFLHPGDSNGDLTLVGAETEPKTVIALGKTSCIGIPIQLAKQELMQNPLFVQRLVKNCCCAWTTICCNKPIHWICASLCSY